MALSNDSIRTVAGVVMYHHTLPRVGDGNRAVVTLRELLSVEAPELQGITKDLVCTAGRYGLDILEGIYSERTGMGASMVHCAVTNDAARLSDKYGMEGEKWIQN